MSTARETEMCYVRNIKCCAIFIVAPSERPKPEEAYIVAPARNMIYKYILVIPQKKSRFVQFKPAMCFWVIAAIRYT